MDPNALTALERIAAAQLVMAGIMVLIGLVVIGGAIAVFLQVRSARRALDHAITELKPQVAPLMDRARHITNDVAGMTDNVRRRTDDVLHTVEELRRAAEKGGSALEERLRRFTAVLDVVQAETEELMLDAAATAHGLQQTARVLREEQVIHPGRRQHRGGGNTAPRPSDPPADAGEEAGYE